jgi:hypothetical protein
MTNNTPLRAIRLKCLDCTNNQVKEVDLCLCCSCPIWTWRFCQRPATAAARGKIVTRKAAQLAGWEVD